MSAIAISLIFSKNNFLNNIKSSAFIGTILILIVFNQDHFFKKLVEKIYFKKRYTPQMGLSNIVENRNGIIVSEDHSPMSEAKNMSVVSGGGAFDGQIDQDGHLAEHLPVDFKRLFTISRLHPHPRRVLQIALSSGMWTRILAGYKNIEHIDAIELNPGYLKLAKNFIGYNDLVANSKVNIIIDDGRRWLIKNPDKKYDLIIFNTPHHYRQMVSHLLSKEFLQLAKKHLNPGGIYFQTVTESEDAIFTASLQFKYIYKIYNMYAGSDSPVLEIPKQSAQNISQFYYMNKPLLISSDPINRAYFDSVLDSPLVDLGQAYRENKELREVTDDNMLTEFKRYKSRLSSIYNW
jgi:SAM-dependent methyltransferase